MIKVEVLVNYPQWKKKIKKIDFFFNEVLKNFPKKYRFPNQKKTLTLLLSDNKNIKKLNSRFRKKNKPTDILSFPLKKKIDRNNFYLGDIIISYQFIEKKKSKNNVLFKKKLVKLFIHGFLHLLGYDHKKNSDYKIMYKKEANIFNLLENKIGKII